MKIKEAEIELFLAITEAKLKTSDRGLVLIQGINGLDSSADSNGAGKSSLADAICWCLYGVTARGVSGDDVINNAAGKGTRVQLEIEDGKDLYRIARHRKHKTGKNSLQVLKFNPATNMFDVDLTKGTDKMTQEVVERIIGAPYEVFKGAIYAGQEQMPDLPGMTDKQLKLLIEEASGTTVLEEAYVEARKSVVDAKLKLDEIDGMSSRLENNQTLLTEQLRLATDNIDVWNAERDQRAKDIRNDVQRRLGLIRDMDKDIADRNIPAIEAVIAGCDIKIAAVKGENQRYAELTQEAATARGSIAVAQTAVKNLETLQQRFTSELNNIQHKIGCDCTECGRTITEAEIAAAKKAALEKVEDSDMRLTLARADLAAVEKTATEKAWAVQAFADKMTDISAVNALRTQKASELAEALEKKRHRDKFTMETKAVGENTKRIMTELNPYSETAVKLRDQITRVDHALNDLVVKLKAARNDLEVAETVAKIFSPAGVRAYILDEITPFLNQQTAKYLATMSDGNIQATWTTLVKNAKGEFKEKFSIEVEKVNGAKLFAGLSGGEKRKVRIAAALALQDLVATRASKPIELFIADEIDDALDEAGLERLMQILEDKASERGSIFIISHNNLKDWISSVVTVENKGGKTTVTEI